MRVLVTGCGGQVGHEVAHALAGACEVVAHDRASLDLADAPQLRERVREARPDVVVNAAAYTAVDRAESEAAAAHAVNAVAPGILGEECRRAGALLLHFSTDYVFDGAKASPYVESDATNPLSVYGRTKLDGERAVAAAGCDHLVLRTSWVYGPRGRNFLFTMLRLGAERDELRVVDDQRGAPTSSLQLAVLVRRLLLERGLARVRAASGIYHATAAGETTWCGFANAIFERRPVRARVVPIATREYPTPARRPANSVLCSDALAAALDVRLGDWRSGLDETLARVPR
jgi:dTDP-4-dehydrorhamnose reductase